MADYVLHAAPDNASLVVRLTLLQMDLPFDIRLIDRSKGDTQGAAYLKLNPNGLIPVLETPDGTVFETAAILLWLADRHHALAPGPEDPQRAGFLKWLFFVSNTLHANLRMNFYPDKYIGPDRDMQRSLLNVTRQSLVAHYAKMNAVLADHPPWFGAPDPSVLDFYVACCLRWSALYPKGDTDWFDLRQFPKLVALTEGLEGLEAVKQAQAAEGLGPRPFSKPTYPNPPIGSVF